MTISALHREDYMLRTTVEAEQLGDFVGQLNEGQPAELVMKPLGVGIFPVTVYLDGEAESEPYRVPKDPRLMDSGWTPTEPDVTVVYEAQGINDIHFDAEDIVNLSPKLVLGFGRVRVKGTITLPSSTRQSTCPRIADGTVVELNKDIQSHTLQLRGREGTTYQADLTLRRLPIEDHSFFNQSMYFDQPA